MPLRILIEAYKTTEIFTNEDLTEIMTFLYYNCNCQCPSMRQQIVAYMTKGFLRIEASHAVCIRDLNSPIPKQYMEFLLKLRDLCVSNLFDGANFSRRSISLNLLLQTIKCIYKLCENPIHEDIWTIGFKLRLTNIICEDSYEANKMLANEIAKYCPKEIMKVLQVDKSVLQQMATSVRPGDSLAAAYYLEFACTFEWHFKSIFEAICFCEELLLNGLQTANTSLLIAARQNPLYGLVFCIKHLLSKVELKTCSYEQWRPFFKRFLKTCIALLKVVAPVVNSSSPEGHLPNDFSELTNLLPNMERITDELPPNKVLTKQCKMENEHFKTTPQMLLLCAWRTVKEISLLLGDITLNAPILRNPNTLNGLITTEEMLDIGLMFQEMLAETKHRGAFEQAYVGFSKLCIRLWRSNEPELHRCPMAWLRDLIHLISGNDESTSSEPTGKASTNLKYEKICATRRSAVVPFMIQALITSELQVCSSNGLHYCMRHLIDLCKLSTNAESRTHALNILRALFRYLCEINLLKFLNYCSSLKSS